MSARVYLSQDATNFNFLRIDQAGDGSIGITILREQKDRKGAMVWDAAQGQMLPNSEPAEGHRRVVYHSTGQVIYEPTVSSPPRFFEPLAFVERQNFFFVVSIPRVDRLAVVAKVAPDTEQIRQVTIPIPDDDFGRVTFGFLIAPLDEEANKLGAYVRLGYDTFALFIAQAQLPEKVAQGLENHFFYVAPVAGMTDSQVCGQLEAELAYHQARTGVSDVIVYPPDGEGVYTLYPSVVMRAEPRLKIEFSEPGLEVEKAEGSRANRIRFRIRKPGGYVKDTDLRPLIRSIELDSEL